MVSRSLGAMAIIREELGYILRIVTSGHGAAESDGRPTGDVFISISNTVASILEVIDDYEKSVPREITKVGSPTPDHVGHLRLPPGGSGSGGNRDGPP